MSLSWMRQGLQRDGVKALSDDPLLDLLDAPVSDRGKVAAAEVLGVNYRTMVTCHASRPVSYAGGVKGGEIMYPHSG